MRAVVVALGGNLPAEDGPVQGVLQVAAARLQASGLRPWAQSGWWASRAWPNPDDPPFVNAVIVGEAAARPEALLETLHRIEADLGRRRGAANAPRTVDLDLIAYGRAVRAGPGLILPHPRAHERLFVMGPLAQVAPGWRHPTLGLTAAQLAAGATVGRDAAPLP